MAVYRRISYITLLCLLASWINAAPAKLSFDQKAPPHARSSAGRALALPRASGQTPANTSLLKPGGGKPPGGTSSQQDNVQREESSSFKEVNGETVRSVVGNYGYQSPEGLPISFKYMADENGHLASFSIGNAAAGGGSGSKSKPSPGSQKPGGGGGPGGAGRGGAGGPTKGGAGGPNKGGPGGPTKGGAGGDGDRKYLPPT